MNHKEYFTYLPSEIIINILSRLPVRTIISCKCVCKSWLELLNSPEFSKTHLSNSIPGLVVYTSTLFKIYEFVDLLDSLESHELQYNLVTKFDQSALTGNRHPALPLNGSANLLFLPDGCRHTPLYIFNPITRDYIQLPSYGGKSDEYCNVTTYGFGIGDTTYGFGVTTYGFGVSKMSGQHKLVRISHDVVMHPKTHLMSVPKFACEIYTLGTGSWRSIAPGGPLRYSAGSIAAYINGNLHWLVEDLEFSCLISCFDLQTELFSTFSPPSELPQRSGVIYLRFVAVLGDMLCLCDDTSDEELVIWLMNDYAVEKSWRKEYVIIKASILSGASYDAGYPIKVSKDGDILLGWEETELLYYSKKTRAISKIDMIERDRGNNIQALTYTPSFLSLKSFTMEDARSF